MVSVPTTFLKFLSEQSKAFLLLNLISAAYGPNLSSSLCCYPYLSGTAPLIWLLPLAVSPLWALFRILDLTLLLFPFHSTLFIGWSHSLPWPQWLEPSSTAQSSLLSLHTHSFMHSLIQTDCSPTMNQELLSGAKQIKPLHLGASQCGRDTLDMGRQDQSMQDKSQQCDWRLHSWGWIRKQRPCEH